MRVGTRNKSTSEQVSLEATSSEMHTRQDKLYSDLDHLVEKMLSPPGPEEQRQKPRRCSIIRGTNSVPATWSLLLLSTISIFHILTDCPTLAASSSSNILDNIYNNNNNNEPQYQQSHRALAPSLSPSVNYLVNNNNNKQLQNNDWPRLQRHQHHQLSQGGIPVHAQSLIRQQMQASEPDEVIESSTVYNSAALPIFQPSLLLAYNSQAQQQRQPSSACQLPPTWVGKWYQANKDPILVSKTVIHDKGVCLYKKGDKYLYESTKQVSTVAAGQQQQQQACLTCLVINERHLNVLQYKESSCQPIPANYLNKTNDLQQLDENDHHSLLTKICSDITGDAQLESLFRLDTPPIECPIIGRYNFTYENCREPHSSLDSCLDKKQLNFRFSACPDVPGSESKSK